jgi:cortactin
MNKNNFSIDKLRDEVKKDSEEKKLKEYEQSQNNFSKGYGGKYGVQKDRLDKSAVGFEYQADIDKHASQKG